MSPEEAGILIRDGFWCPICAFDAYVRKVVVRPDRSRYVTSFYKCGGCQVMFCNRSHSAAAPTRSGVVRDRSPDLFRLTGEEVGTGGRRMLRRARAALDAARNEPIIGDGEELKLLPGLRLREDIE